MTTPTKLPAEKTGETTFYEAPSPTDEAWGQFVSAVKEVERLKKQENVWISTTVMKVFGVWFWISIALVIAYAFHFLSADQIHFWGLLVCGVAVAAGIIGVMYDVWCETEQK